jgi:hypothetical protein
VLLATSVVAVSCGRDVPVAAEKRLQTPKTSTAGVSEPWPGVYPKPTRLRGLRSVALHVYLDLNIPSPPTRRSVQDEMEQVIRGSFATEGIAVVDEGEAAGVLEVSVYLSCEPGGSSCGYHTEFALRQWVQLRRDRTAQVAAITWQNSYSNGISKSELGSLLPDMLMVDVRSLLNAFIEQYREANPG